MKVKIKVGFSAKIQAASYSPIEENDGIELEVDVEDEDQLAEKIEKWQKFIQNKVLNGLKKGSEKFKEAFIKARDI